MQTQSDARFYFKCHSIREAACLPQHAQQKAVGLQGHGIARSPDEVQPEEGKSSKDSSGFWPGFQDSRQAIGSETPKCTVLELIEPSTPSPCFKDGERAAQRE